MLYKTVTRPTLAYGSECWTLSKRSEIMLRIFERRMLRMIYGPVNDNGIGRTGYSNELYTFCDELHTVKVMKIGRWKWLGHLFRMQ
jgi:hypothetical protein